MATAAAPPRRSSRTRRIVLISLAVIALVVLALVTWFAVWMTSGHRGLQRSLDQLQLPGQVRLVEHEQLGNPLCLDQCPMIQREYRSALDPAATGEAFAATLSGNGFSQVARDSEYRVFDATTDDRCDSTGSEPPRYVSGDGFSRTCWVGDGERQGILLTVAAAEDRPETVVRLQIAAAEAP
jgi:hypothetical protein